MLERLSLEVPLYNPIVGYFEAEQGDFISSEEDIVTLFQEHREEIVGNSAVGYMHFEESSEVVDANINSVLTHS